MIVKSAKTEATMLEKYYDKDADMSAISSKTIAVISLDRREEVRH